MKRDWKPGDVAMVPGVGVCLRHRDGRWLNTYTALPMRGTDRFEGIKPRVVIDPENSDDADALAKALVEAMHRAGDKDSAANGVHPATVAAALRSLIAPPRPDEPMGLGAVVEDEWGMKWLREHSGFWRNEDRASAEWATVRAVRVLTEGI